MAFIYKCNGRLKIKMFHIIVLILKILGIILLTLIGIILLILILALCVPVRYRLFAERGEEHLFIKGGISWLLHLLHATVYWEDDDQLHIIIRVFGIILYDNLRHKKSIKNRNKKMKARAGKKVNRRKRKKDEPIIRTTVPEDKTKHEDDDVIRTIDTQEASMQKKSDRTKTLETEKKDMLFINNQGETTQENGQDVGQEDEKLSFFQKLLRKLQKLKDRIVEFFRRLKSRIIHIIETVDDLKKKKDLILGFIHNEMNKEGFRQTLSSLKRLGRHVMPTKLKAELIFGTGDPCSTGQALGLIAVLYSFYGDKLNITPDFENKRLEGTLYARGRIRLGTILIIFIKLIIDKRFKEFKKNVIILKEAL